MSHPRGKKDPDNPPPRRPGDKYLVIGFIIGGIAGGVLGAFLNFLIISAIGGGILGLYVPALARKYKRYRVSKTMGKDIFS